MTEPRRILIAHLRELIKKDPEAYANERKLRCVAEGIKRVLLVDFDEAQGIVAEALETNDEAQEETKADDHHQDPTE